VSGVKPHILVLNKKDLADLQMRSKMENILRKYGYHHIFFTDCRDSKCPGVKQVGRCKKCFRCKNDIISTAKFNFIMKQ
jgi:ethanolamine utilization protein EutP (predicted NTPase)